MIPFYCQKANQNQTPPHNTLSPIKTRLAGKQSNTRQVLVCNYYVARTLKAQQQNKFERCIRISRFRMTVKIVCYINPIINIYLKPLIETSLNDNTVQMLNSTSHYYIQGT